MNFFQKHKLLGVLVSFFLIGYSIWIIIPYFRGREYLDQQRDKKTAKLIYEYLTKNSIKTSLTSNDVEIIFLANMECTKNMIQSTSMKTSTEIQQQQITFLNTCIKEKLSNKYSTEEIKMVIDAFNTIWTTNRYKF